MEYLLHGFLLLVQIRTKLKILVDTQVLPKHQGWKGVMGDSDPGAYPWAHSLVGMANSVLCFSRGRVMDEI